MRHLLLALGCATTALAPASAAAATTVPGGNVINQTWTVAGSPYVVEGDVTVPAGASLTIQSGAVVRFAATDAQAAGLDTARVELTVRGTLTVSGTAEAPVLFESATSTAANAWFGIVVDATATSASITGAVIQHAYAGIHSAGNLSVVDTTVRSSTDGVLVSAGSPTLDGLMVTSTVDGLYVSGGSPTVTRSVFVGNTDAGIYAAPFSASAVTVAGCTLHGNGSYGVRAAPLPGGSGAMSVAITGSNITGNGLYGVYRGSPEVVTVTHSNVWGNGVNFMNALPGAGALSANPLYAAPPGNLRLTSNSPSRRSGPAGEDLGALPYAGDPTPALVGTLWSDYTVAAGTTAVPGDLTVAPGATLTVPAGAALWFGSGDLMAAGLDSARAELVVQGTLRAEGNAAGPVAFRSADGAALGWYGIEVTSLTTTTVVSGATIDGSYAGLTLLSTSATNVLRDITIRGGLYGVVASGGTPTLDAVTVASAATGISLSGVSGGAITNAVVQGATNTGISVRQLSGSATVAVVNATVNASGNAGLAASASTGATLTVRVTNCVVTSSAGPGISRDAAGGIVSITTTYSDVWGNAPNFQNTVAGTGCISQNPMYVDASSDLRLQPGSVCIDAGTSTGAPAGDRAGAPRPLDGDGINGAAVDMGAYERPAAPFCGDGTVDPGEVCDEGTANGEYLHCASSCQGPGPRCGDGIGNGPEACDDANGSNTDACLNTCVAARCGDGFVHAGVEECDDGNDAAGDGCSPGCRAEQAAPAGGGGAAGGGGGCNTAPGWPGGGLLLLAAGAAWRRRAPRSPRPARPRPPAGAPASASLSARPPSPAPAPRPS